MTLIRAVNPGGATRAMAPNADGQQGICSGSGSRDARTGRSPAGSLRESLALSFR